MLGVRLMCITKQTSKCPSIGGWKGGFAAMPLLQIHVFKSTRMHHFEGQIAEAPIVGEG